MYFVQRREYATTYIAAACRWPSLGWILGEELHWFQMLMKPGAHDIKPKRPDEQWQKRTENAIRIVLSVTTKVRGSSTGLHAIMHSWVHRQLIKPLADLTEYLQIQAKSNNSEFWTEIGWTGRSSGQLFLVSNSYCSLMWLLGFLLRFLHFPISLGITALRKGRSRSLKEQANGIQCKSSTWRKSRSAVACHFIQLSRRYFHYQPTSRYPVFIA